MIVDIRDYTQFTTELGDEAAARLASLFAKVVNDVIARGGGRVVELRGDEVLAVFGSARQALRTATVLQKQTREKLEGVHIGIGLDAGEAVPVEGGFRGSALNVAARLCALAGKGQVLASSTVTSLAGALPDIRYSERGAVHLKGVPRPTEHFLVQHQSDADTPSSSEQDSRPRRQDLPVGGFLGSLPTSPLIGRSHIMAELCEILDEVTEGRGRLILLEGEPGVGKTRLAQEVTAEARERGFLIAAGSCYDTRQSSAYFPFTSILSTLHDHAPADVRDNVTRQWPFLSRLIPAIPSQGVSGPEDAHGQDRLLWMVSRFVEKSSDARPVAILLDDLQWADSSSLELLRYLAHSVRSSCVLLLATYRDTETAPGNALDVLLGSLNRQGLVSTFALTRLDAVRTRDLLISLTGDGTLSSSLANLIHSRTEGNPLFVEQIVRMMSDHGFSGDSKESEEVLRGLVSDVPDTVRAVTLQRLSTLDKDAQEILRVGSIFGQTFLFDDLLALLLTQGSDGRLTMSPNEDRLDSLIQAATRIGLVQTQDEDHCSFDHALTRECLYRELTPRRRARLHRGAAEVILQSKGLISRVGEAAEHYIRAGDSTHALPLVLEAASRARELGAHVEAEAHYRCAITLATEVSEPDSVALAHEGLGETYLAAGRYLEAGEQLNRAGALSTGDGQRRGKLEIRTALALAAGQRAEEGLARLDELLASRRIDSDPRLLGQAHAVRARCYLSLDRPEKEVEAAASAERCARQSGDLGTLASALIDRATGMSDLGDGGDVLPLLSEAAEIAKNLGDADLLSRALNNAAVCSWESIGLAAAEGYHRQALEAAEQSASPTSIAHGRAVLGMYAWMRGEWTEAMHWFESAASVAASLRLSSASWALTNPGWLLSLKGKEALATSMLEKCLERAISEEDDLLLMYAKLRLAEQHLIHGRARNAQALAAECQAHPAVRGWQKREWLLVSVQAALDSRDVKGARRHLDELPIERWGEPWLMVDCRRLTASCLAAEGKPREAERAFEEALALAEQLPCRPGQGDILRSWGEALMTQRPDEAAVKLSEARNVYKELGARPMVEAVEVELLSLPATATFSLRSQSR